VGVYSRTVPVPITRPTGIALLTWIVNAPELFVSFDPRSAHASSRGL
jgi:hypothetical protein